MADEKIWYLSNEFVVNLEEQFYVSDIEFNSEKLNLVFYEIIRLFVEKNEINNYKKNLSKFVKDCLEETDQDGLNDYSLFYDNLNILLEFDFINDEDIEKIKVRINNQITILNKDKKLILSNIS